MECHHIDVSINYHNVSIDVPYTHPREPVVVLPPLKYVSSTHCTKVRIIYTLYGSTYHLHIVRKYVSSTHCTEVRIICTLYGSTYHLHIVRKYVSSTRLKETPTTGHFPFDKRRPIKLKFPCTSHVYSREQYY